MRNPLAFLFEKKSAYDLSNAALVELFGSTPTATGIAVSPTSALSVPAVSASVRVIAESLAQLPLFVFKRDGDIKTKDRDNPLYRILHEEPNPWTSSFDFRNQLQTDVLLHGNGYAYTNRVGGKVRELTRLPPGSVTVKAEETGEPVYSIKQTSGEPRKCAFTDILHIKAQSTDGICGLAPIQQGREAIALAIALEKTHAALHANGAQPGGVLAVKGKLDGPARERLKSAWQAFQGGLQNRFKTAVLDVDATWSPLQMNGVDSQHLETRRFQIEEISRIMRVPPHLLSELGRATWGNASEMGQNFLDYCLLPWLMQWQGALTRTLLTPVERRIRSSNLIRQRSRVQTSKFARNHMRVLLAAHG